MRFLVVLIVSLVGCVNLTYAQTQSILPIADVVKGSNLSKPDNSTIGFIGSRCGNLFTTIGGYFSANANKDSEKKIAEDFINRAEIFSFVGVYVDSNLNKKTNDAIRSQNEALSKAYIDDMLAGKRLNNNVFTKLVESDVSFCANQFSEYLLIYKKIYDSANKNK